MQSGAYHPQDAGQWEGAGIATSAVMNVSNQTQCAAKSRQFRRSTDRRLKRGWLKNRRSGSKWLDACGAPIHSSENRWIYSPYAENFLNFCMLLAWLSICKGNGSNIVRRTIALATGSGISWTHCARIYFSLTSEERRALKVISIGRQAGCSFEVIGRLQTLALIKHNGRRIALTADGKFIAMFC